MRIALVLWVSSLSAVRAQLPDQALKAKEAAIQKARNGQTEEALKTLEELSKRHPNDIGLIQDRVVILSEAGEARRALSLFQQLDAAKSPSYVIRATVDACRQVGESDLALQLVNQQIKKGPDNTIWKLSKSQLLLDKGDGLAAAKVLEELPEESRAKADWLKLRTMAAVSEKDWPTVVRYNQLQMDAQPKPDLDRLKLQLNAYLELGKDDEALSLTETIGKHFPEDDKVTWDRLVLLARAGKNKEAFALIEKIDPGKCPDFVAHAAVDVCRELNQSDAALKIIDKRLAQDVDSAAWRIRKAQIFVDQGDGMEAGKELEKIQGQGRNHPDWLNVRILAAQSSEDWAAVIRFNQQRIDSSNQPGREVLKTQADAYIHQKKYSEALVILEALCRRFPKDQELAQERAVISAISEGPRKALEYFKKMDADKAPDYVIKTAIAACRELGETALAFTFVNARLARNPDHPVWKIHHAQLLVDQGNPQQAAADLEKFRNVRHKYPDWLDVRIYAAQMAEDWAAVLRYSQEKAEREKNPDVSVLGLQVDALIHLGAAHAAERILQEHPELLSPARNTNVTDRIAAVELLWSGFASLTMSERIRRAESVIRRLEQYEKKTPLPRKLANLKVVALHNANRWQQAVDDYQSLKEAGKVAPHIRTAVAGSYLSLKQPEESNELYQEIYDEGFADEEVIDGLFYSLVEIENFSDAYQLIDRLTYTEPTWNKFTGSPDYAENNRKLEVEVMAAEVRYYGDQLNEAWQRISRLRYAAPGNGWIRETYASIALAREWHHKALENFLAVAAVNPNSTGALTGIAKSHLDLNNLEEAESRLLELEAVYPENPDVKQLRKDLEIYEKAELWTEFIFAHSKGPELDGDGVLATAELYGSPVAYRWRPVAQWRYAWAEIIEGSSYLGHVGVAAEYRSPDWEILAGGGYVESRSRKDGIGSARVSWSPGDHWELSGEYSSFNLDTPLRALWYGIAADRSGASVSYRWHESRQLSLNLVRSDFTDGNERWEAGALIRQRLIDIPHLDVDALFSAYGSQNSREDAPYYNPEEDLSFSIGLDAEHILWRRYDRTWVQRLTGELGNYDQKNFGSDWTGRIAYEHRLTLYPDWEFIVGMEGGRRIYDGEAEPYYGINFLLHARF